MEPQMLAAIVPSLRELNMIRVMPVLVVLLAVSGSVFAQRIGRLQDGFYSGQYSGQYSGRYNPRVDGRGGHNQGFPPSAADKDNRIFDNPVRDSDCTEVDAFAPDARPGWQARVRLACQ
jgi:hypothetical protein